MDREPRCALSVVHFDLDLGLLRHVGIRAAATVTPTDADRLKRFVGKYLGNDSAGWNSWFVTHIVDPLDPMVELRPTSTVAKDVSFFKTGPDLASPPFPS